MAFTPKAILVTTKSELASELAANYTPDLLLTGLSVASSPHAALEYFMGLPIDLCLISDTFKPDDYQALINDVKRIDNHKTCIFVVVTLQAKGVKDRNALKQFGVETIVTPAGDSGDRAAITAALKEKIGAWELGRRIEDCLAAIGLLSKDIERTARERKRGRETLYNTSISNFLRSNLAFAPEIEEKYFEFLYEKMLEAQPFAASTVDVPQEVLDRNLPKLSRDNYRGASARVWERLLHKFGDKSTKNTENAAPSEKPGTEGPKEN